MEFFENSHQVEEFKTTGGRLFENNGVTITMRLYFPTRIFVEHKFKFFRRSVNGKHLMRFQSENSVFKFIRRSVDGASVTFRRLL